MREKGVFPDLKDDARENALARAWERFLSKDPGSQARNAGAEIEDGRISLTVMGRRCIIDPSSRSASIDGEELEPITGMLVLLYLSGAGDAQVTGNLISFRQLPGGEVFFPTFRGRVIEAIGELFLDRPENLLDAAGTLGAKRAELGDVSVRIDVFSKLPLTIILWRGDDEVPGSANVLFDESASRIMDTEDLALVGSLLVASLVKARSML